MKRYAPDIDQWLTIFLAVVGYTMGQIFGHAWYSPIFWGLGTIAGIYLANIAKAASRGR